MKQSSYGLVVLAGALFAMLPWLNMPAFWQSFLYIVFYWGVLAVSWNLFSGVSGYFSFGHGAFFGIGMYTVAYFCGHLEMPFLPILILAGFLAGLFGLGIGALVFRVHNVRGELFALLTLAVTFVIATIVLNTPIDGGPGVYLNSVAIPKFGPNAAATFYLMMLALLIVTMLAAIWIYSSKLGLGLSAIHDDEDAAEVMGVPTYRSKLVGLFISTYLAGMAGAIQALFVSYVTANETFSITIPLFVVLMSVLGGTRHWAGPLLGAIVITGIQYFFTVGDSALMGKMILGLILIAVILFIPNGLLGNFARLRAKKNSQKIVETLKNSYTQSPMKEVQQPTTQVLLQTHGLSKSFSGVKALQNLDLEIYQGEILGLLGPNGSGKSTFINVISGHFAATGGQKIFQGKDITGLSAHEIAVQGITRTYQTPRPFNELTVLDNTRLVASYAGNKSLEEASELAYAALTQVGLENKADALPSDLNLHQRKFLEFARALAAKPKLLMLDEVLSGLTPSEIQSSVELIQKIRSQGTTILFVEHVMSAVMALADRIAVLNHGQLIAKGLPTEVMRNPEVMAAYLGKKAE
jgi:branched-chain amino acid transport system permease protein